MKAYTEHVAAQKKAKLEADRIRREREEREHEEQERIAREREAAEEAKRIGMYLRSVFVLFPARLGSTISIRFLILMLVFFVAEKISERRARASPQGRTRGTEGQTRCHR